MVSFKHQGLCKLLGERPVSAQVLLQMVPGVELPGNLEIVPGPETIRELQLPEYAADVVVAHRRTTHGKPEEAFVFEVQLRPDDDKRRSWPIHVAGSAARLGCPTSLVVLATNERTARWASVPIDVGRGRMVLEPFVVGPQQIPRMLEPDEARACPELATLAVMVHGHQPESKRLGRNAIEAVLAKPEECDTLLLELILGSLPGHTLREIEDEMELHTTPLLSNWSKQRIAKGRKEGRQEARQEALRLVLDTRGLELSPEQRARIEQCNNSRQLDAWLRRAVTAQSVEQMFHTERRARARVRVAVP